MEDMDEEEQDRLADDTAEVEEVILCWYFRFWNMWRQSLTTPRDRLSLRTWESSSPLIMSSAKVNDTQKRQLMMFKFILLIHWF
jgi:hypothetical protein